MKKTKIIILFISFFVLISFAQQVSAQNIFSCDSSVKALWRFENGALGTDSKGANNLVVAGPTSDIATYKEGAAAAYLNALEKDIFFTCDDDLDEGFPLRSSDTNKDISVVFWFKLDSLPELYRTIFHKGRFAGPLGTNRSMSIAVSDSDQMRIRISSDGKAWNNYDHASVLDINKWYHVAVTYQGSSGAYRIRIWDDAAGAILGLDKVGIAGNVSLSSSPLSIGSGTFNNSGYNMDGNLDEMVVFDRVITTDEIDQIRKGNYGTCCQNHDTWGYAWSDNVGWISFSCINGADSSHWKEVDDVVPDDSVTRVWTSSSGEQKDAYNLEDPSVLGVINQVRVRMRYQGTIKTYLRLNGIEIQSPGSRSVFSAWEDYSTAWQLSRPGGGNWTWNDIRDLQVVVGLSAYTSSDDITDCQGIFSSSLRVTQGQLTQIYVEVDYSGGTLILRPNGDGDYINIENPSTAEEVCVDYGVDIDGPAEGNTGAFSGYAWSDNIGWISFDRSETGAPPSDDVCPDGSCIAKLDLENAEVSGWARALAPIEDPNAGGWDGWIKLRDPSYEDGVSLDSNPDPSEFEGWAWGSDVIGWISFNDRDLTGSPGPFDYQVMTNIKVILNEIPSATNLSVVQTSGCGLAPIVRFSWDYNDEDNVPPGTDPQSAYEIQIGDAGGLITTLSGDSDTFRDYSPPSFGTTYWWRVRVQDTNGPVWSDWTDGPNFTPIEWPDPDFTWCPEEPDIGEPIQFCSVLGGACNPAAEPACNLIGDLTTCAAGCSFWAWDFGDGGTSGLQNPTYSYFSPGAYVVRLTVTDADGHSCFRVLFVPISTPLPVWKEIPPF